MKQDITAFFNQLIRQSGTMDIAKAEFSRILADDIDLQNDYREWCEDMGYTERKGFDHYCEEYMDSQQSVFDSFNDFDE